jgi:type VI secretion system protein VasG
VAVVGAGGRGIGEAGVPDENSLGAVDTAEGIKMVSVNVKSLVAKLNDVCRRALDDAAGLCVSRTHYNVEVEHWLLRLLDTPNTDLPAILAHFGADASRLKKDLTRAIDHLKTGNARVPALSPNLVTLFREAWLIASLSGASRTRSGHLIQALMSDESLARLARETSDEFGKINPDTLSKDFYSIATGLAEDDGPAASDGGAGAPGQPRAGGPSRTQALDQFTIDLTERARSGKIDPVLGRDSEIRQVIDILTRRRQNNPILTGEAGVGKTAVVEGFALRVAAGDVPPSLADISVRTLDLGLLQAGASVKGEFENRLKSVIEEVKGSARPIILFIDEAHTLIGAGGQAGQGDAANLLKPALARGELRTIAATTWAEYKEYFEKDAALARRFQVVKVEEPSEQVAVAMMRGLVETLERHHKVEVLDEAVTEAVRLSHRYLSGRQLPDKAVSLLDTACARVAIRLTSVPPPLEDARRRLDQNAVTMGILNRESAATADHTERIAELEAQQSQVRAELDSLTQRWDQESKLVQQIREIRGKLAGISSDASKSAGQAGGGAATAASLSESDRAKLKTEMSELTARLKQLQGEKPLAQVSVDAQAVAEVVAGWTGIPVGRMVADEIKTVLNLKERLEERIIGQSHALEAIAQSVRTSRAHMTDPRKPIGVFLMVGTSGVGKTETSIALAELLYGGDQNMTVINMSEFKEEHKVSLLMGSPPGYVGYGKGGVLTEAVRRKPYSVVLLDEMEKAHSGVQDIFYQVFDKGIMRDGEGRDIDFKNTLILMTSNAGTDLITKLCADPETRPTHEALAELLLPELQKTFKPAFLGRVTIVPYFPLADDVMRKIIELQLGRVKRRVRESYKAAFAYDAKVLDSIAERCKEVSTGARNVDHILTRSLLPELSGELLSRMAEGQSVKSVQVTVGDGGGFAYQID